MGNLLLLLGLLFFPFSPQLLDWVHDLSFSVLPLPGKALSPGGPSCLC